MAGYYWERWIADDLRAAGLTVHEVEGWKNRGRPASTGAHDPSQGTTNHHTASTTSAANPHPTLKLLIEGRKDLPGPLAHVSVDHRGEVWVIAAGRCNHAGLTNKSVPGVPAGSDGNAHFLGDEIDTNGTQPLSPEQRHSVAVVNRVFTDHKRLKNDRIHRHADLTTRKWDIGSISTAALRADAAAVTQEEPDMEPKQIAGAPITLTEPGGKKVETTVQGAFDDTRDRVLAGNKRMRDMDVKLDKILDILGKEAGQ